MSETLGEVLNELEKARRNLYRESEEAGQVSMFGAPAAVPEPAPVATAPVAPAPEPAPVVVAPAPAPEPAPVVPEPAPAPAPKKGWSKAAGGRVYAELAVYLAYNGPKVDQAARIPPADKLRDFTLAVLDQKARVNQSEDAAKLAARVREIGMPPEHLAPKMWLDLVEHQRAMDEIAVAEEMRAKGLTLAPSKEDPTVKRWQNLNPKPLTLEEERAKLDAELHELATVVDRTADAVAALPAHDRGLIAERIIPWASYAEKLGARYWDGIERWFERLGGGDSERGRQVAITQARAEQSAKFAQTEVAIARKDVEDRLRALGAEIDAGIKKPGGVIFWAKVRSRMLDDKTISSTYRSTKDLNEVFDEVAPMVEKARADHAAYMQRAEEKRAAEEQAARDAAEAEARAKAEAEALEADARDREVRAKEAARQAEVARENAALRHKVNAATIRLHAPGGSVWRIEGLGDITVPSLPMTRSGHTRMKGWLLDMAQYLAAKRGDENALLRFSGETIEHMPIATSDDLAMYLFGDTDGPLSVEEPPPFASIDLRQVKRGGPLVDAPAVRICKHAEDEREEDRIVELHDGTAAIMRQGAFDPETGIRSRTVYLLGLSGSTRPMPFREELRGRGAVYRFGDKHPGDNVVTIPGMGGFGSVEVATYGPVPTPGLRGEVTNVSGWDWELTKYVRSNYREVDKSPKKAVKDEEARAAYRVRKDGDYEVWPPLGNQEAKFDDRKWVPGVTHATENGLLGAHKVADAELRGVERDRYGMAPVLPLEAVRPGLWFIRSATHRLAIRRVGTNYLVESGAFSLSKGSAGPVFRFGKARVRLVLDILELARRRNWYKEAQEAGQEDLFARRPDPEPTAPPRGREHLRLAPAKVDPTVRRWQDLNPDATRPRAPGDGQRQAAQLAATPKPKRSPVEVVREVRGRAVDDPDAFRSAYREVRGELTRPAMQAVEQAMSGDAWRAGRLDPAWDALEAGLAPAAPVKPAAPRDGRIAPELREFFEGADDDKLALLPSPKAMADGWPVTMTAAPEKIGRSHAIFLRHLIPEEAPEGIKERFKDYVAAHGSVSSRSRKRIQDWNDTAKALRDLPTSGEKQELLDEKQRLKRFEDSDYTEPGHGHEAGRGPFLEQFELWRAAVKEHRDKLVSGLELSRVGAPLDKEAVPAIGGRVDKETARRARAYGIEPEKFAILQRIGLAHLDRASDKVPAHLDVQGALERAFEHLADPLRDLGRLASARNKDWDNAAIARRWSEHRGPILATLEAIAHNMGHLASFEEAIEGNAGATALRSRRGAIDELGARIGGIDRSARSDIFDTPMNPLEAAFEKGYKKGRAVNVDRRRDQLAAKDSMYRQYRDSLARLQREAAARKRDIRGSEDFTKLGGILLIGNDRHYREALSYVQRVERSTYGEVLTRPGQGKEGSW